MARRCLVVNLDRCTGCDSCITACKYENHISLGNYFNSVVKVGPTGTFPDVELYWLPKFCQQCENPGCIEVCPTGASYRDEETGVVLVDTDACIGCQLCMEGCPFGVRNYDEERNVVEKCSLCFHLTQDGSGTPPCAWNCPAGARFYGDLDDPNSAASIELAKYNEEDIYALPDENGTAPVTRYILSKYGSWQGVF